MDSHGRLISLRVSCTNKSVFAFADYQRKAVKVLSVFENVTSVMSHRVPGSSSEDKGER